MEKRYGKINISAAGGTAGKGSKTYKITLPSSWLLEMDLNQNNRQVELSFDGDSITIEKRSSMDEFISKKRAKNHELKMIYYYDADNLCTSICADFTDKILCAENHTEDLIKTSFGKKEIPLWEDFISFLEERCIPRERAGIREYLETIGIEEYDPIEIIYRTAGRMAEDQQWLKIEVIK